MSLTNEKKYDIDNLTQRHLLYKQFVAWSCNDSSVAPLSDYMNNPMYQELTPENQYFDVKSDEGLYLDLRATSGYVKEAKKLEKMIQKLLFTFYWNRQQQRQLGLRVWAYSLGEYLYTLTTNGLTLRHRTYTINQTDDDLLEWEEKNQRGKGFSIGLVASTAVPLLGEVTKPILKKILVVEKEEGEDETKNSTWKISHPTESELAQRYIFCGKVRKNK